MAANDIPDGSDEEEPVKLPWMGRSATICAIEMAEPMFAGPSATCPFRQALQCVYSIYRNKIICSDSDFVGVVLFGSEQKKGSEVIDGMYVLQDLGLPSAEKILELEAMIDGDLLCFKKTLGFSSSYSLHDALWLCSTMFSHANKCCRLASKQILVFPASDQPPDAVSGQLKTRVVKKVEDIRANHISVEVVVVTDDFQPQRFYSDLLFDESLADADSSCSTGMLCLESLQKRVCQRVYKRRVLGTIPMFLGEGLRLAVSLYSLISPAVKPRIVRVCRSSNEEVQSVTTNEDTTTGTAYHSTEISQYLEYGGKSIQLTNDEVRGLGSICDRGLVVVGFCPIDDLDSCYHVQPASFIYPEDSWIKGSRKLFGALLSRCSNRRKAIMARLVARRNAAARMVALLPQLEVLKDGVQVSPPGFHVIYRPFLDDIRQIDTSASVSASDVQISAAGEIVSKLRFSYRPELVDNPDLQQHWSNIEALALDRDSVSSVADLSAMDIDRIEHKAGHLIAEFRQLVFPKSEDSTELEVESAESTLAKRAKYEPKDVDSMREVVKLQQVDTLTVSCIKDFLKSVKVVVTGKKKAQLVQHVYEYFG